MRPVLKQRSPFYRCVRLVLLILPVILVFAIVWMRSNIVSLEYELARLEKQKRALLSEKISLVAKRAELTALDRIEQLAVRKFGLTYTDRKKVVFVREMPEAGPYSTRFGEDQ